MGESIYQFKVTDIHGKLVSLCDYQGKVLLIVNTASKCGFTPQYAGLEELYTKYKEQGLVILGFPCNQFGGQESGDEASIAQFCDLNYKISFPLFSKVEVNGKNAAPLYQYLTKNAKGILGTSSVKWNFTKFLVNRKGEVITRFAPKDKPEAIEDCIKKII